MRHYEDDQAGALDNLLQVCGRYQVVRQSDIRQISLVPVRRVDDFSQVSALNLNPEPALSVLTSSSENYTCLLFSDPHPDFRLKFIWARCNVLRGNLRQCSSPGS